MNTCPNCNIELSEGGQFCPRCGTSLTGHPPVPYTSPERIGPFLKQDIAAYVGNNSPRYLEQMEKTEKKQLTFHWPCALTGIYWMAYRKLYSEIWIALGISFATAIITSLLSSLVAPAVPLHFQDLVDSGFNLLDSIIFFIACGFLGNPLYIRKMKKKLTEEGCVKRQPINDPHLYTRLTAAGGCSVVSVFVVLGIFIALGILIAIFIFFLLLPSFSGSF